MKQEDWDYVLEDERSRIGLALAVIVNCCLWGCIIAGGLMVFKVIGHRFFVR
jgi:hypothetical protein